MPVRLFFTLLTVLPLFPLGAFAQTQISLTPSRDTVLFEDDFAELSSGQGEHLFAGRLLTGERRRSLIAFDFSAIPAGATILDARLTLYMSKSPPAAGAVTVSLHRAAAGWGEAGSDSGSGGMGDSAQIGDASWGFRIFDQTPWQTPGGDFAPVASAQTLVSGLVGPYDWSDVDLARDVQNWLNFPASNHGWILVGAESAVQTARRFESRENSVNPNRVPALAVSYQFTPAGMPEPAAVPAMTGPGIWLLIIVMLLVGCRRHFRQQMLLQK